MKKLGYKALLSYMPFQKKINYKNYIKTCNTKYYNGIRYIDKGTDGMTSILYHSKFIIGDDHISNYVWNNMDKVIFLDNSYPKDLVWFLYYSYKDRKFGIFYSKNGPFLLSNEDEMFDACVKESKFIPVIIFGPTTEFELLASGKYSDSCTCITSSYDIWINATDFSRLDIFKDKDMISKIKRKMLHNTASYDDYLSLYIDSNKNIKLEDSFDSDYISTVLLYESIYDTVDEFKENIVKHDARFRDLIYDEFKSGDELDKIYRPREKYITNKDYIYKDFPLMIRMIAKLSEFRITTAHLAILTTIENYMAFDPEDPCDWSITFNGDNEPYIEFSKPNDVSIQLSENYLGIESWEYQLDDRVLFDYLYFPEERKEIYKTRSNNKSFNTNTNETLKDSKEEETMDKRMTIECSMNTESNFNNEIMKEFINWILYGGNFLKDNIKDVSAGDILSEVDKIARMKEEHDLNVQFLLDMIEVSLSLESGSIIRELAYKEFIIWSLENRGILLFDNLSLYFDDINTNNINKLLTWSIDITKNGAYNLAEFNKLIKSEEFSKQRFKSLIYKDDIIECSDCYASTVRGLNDSGTEVPYFITIFRSGNDVYFTFNTEEFLDGTILDATNYKYKLHINLLVSNPIDTYIKVVNTVFKLLVTNINSNIL